MATPFPLQDEHLDDDDDDDGCDDDDDDDDEVVVVVVVMMLAIWMDDRDVEICGQGYMDKWWKKREEDRERRR